MDLLLSGATGFLGSYFLRLGGGAYRVHALARHTPAPLPGVTWIECDLTHGLPVERLPRNIDAVVHLAQSRRDRDFPDGARDMFAVNVSSTLELLEYARTCGARRFVLASSGGVYGASPQPLSETDALNPSGLYPTSKQCAEALAACYRTYFALVILRPFFIYGPGQIGRLIPGLAARIAHGEDIQVAGDEGPRVNPVFVDDMVSVLRTALRPEIEGTYNVAGPEVASIRRIAQMIGTIIGSQPRFSSPAGSAASDLVANIDRLRALGCVPRIGLEEGLRQTLAAMRSAATPGV